MAAGGAEFPLAQGGGIAIIVEKSRHAEVGLEAATRAESRATPGC